MNTHAPTAAAAPRPPRRRASIALITGAALALAGCTLTGEGGGDAPDPTGEEETAEQGEASGTVRVVTHDSFYLPEELLDQFQTESGYTLEFSAPGDAGALVNQLILTSDAPLGDVVYGVDNAFASRGIAEEVFADYAPETLPASAQDYLIDGGNALTPIDLGDVCLNIDHQWFADNDVAEPTGLADLTDAQYADLLVVTNPATSSPGLAFLLATVAEFGDGWSDYWANLAGNGLLVEDSWSTAYFEVFSGASDDGTRPIVLSYASSPAAEVGDDGEQPPTTALLDSCFRQVEYAGVLADAENPDGGQAFIDFLLTDAVQAELPWNMFMYPINTEVELPEEFAQWAPLADDPYTMDPSEIDANREDWIATWTETVVG